MWPVLQLIGVIASFVLLMAVVVAYKKADGEDSPGDDEPDKS
jgi:hypothetical protein